MSDLIPKAGGAKSGVKIGGLGPAAQRLQAAREKAARAQNSSKPLNGTPVTSVKAKSSFAGAKKTTFQRKAV